MPWARTRGNALSHKGLHGPTARSRYRRGDFHRPRINQDDQVINGHFACNIINIDIILILLLALRMVGPASISVVITDGGADWTACKDMVQAKFPWIFFLHCLTHQSSTALKYIFQIPEVIKFSNYLMLILFKILTHAFVNRLPSCLHLWLKRKSGSRQPKPNRWSKRQARNTTMVLAHLHILPTLDSVASWAE